MSQFEIPSTGRQVYIAELLERQRRLTLRQAVEKAAQTIGSPVLFSDMRATVPKDSINLLLHSKLPDYLVFAAPAILRHAPATLGYYRLLLGISQKQFYQPSTGLNIFRTMEESNRITPQADEQLTELCCELNSEISKLLYTLTDASLDNLILELPLVTFGAQADGSWRNTIGTKATTSVFDALKTIVRESNRNTIETQTSIAVINNSEREVLLMMAPDPDVVIREKFGEQESVYKAAIEIKGGTDASNLHNRVGEAEKSHQKARAAGAGDCWTIIDLRGADLDRLRQESPTTREWFDLTEVLSQSGPTWNRLTQVTRSAMGI